LKKIPLKLPSKTLAIFLRETPREMKFA